jgi:hypothetical protein
MFAKLFGTRHKRRGVRPERHAKASRGLLRTILKSLEAISLVEKSTTAKVGLLGCRRAAAAAAAAGSPARFGSRCMAARACLKLGAPALDVTVCVCVLWPGQARPGQARPAGQQHRYQHSS